MNYGHIAAALDFYKGRGYTYVNDAPWYVCEEAYYATKPNGASDISINFENPTFVGRRLNNRGYLVASGEQSFIQMMLDGQPIKRAICITPCFRAERDNDWHRPHFVKAELINAHDVDMGHLLHMVHDACSFFEGFIRDVRIIEPIDAPGTFDIVEKDTRVELGSYGIREVTITGKKLRWIYGTGCAEPRLSSVLSVCR